MKISCCIFFYFLKFFLVFHLVITISEFSKNFSIFDILSVGQKKLNNKAFEFDPVPGDDSFGGLIFTESQKC